MFPDGTEIGFSELCLKQVYRVGERINPRTFSSCGLIPDWLLCFFTDVLQYPSVQIPCIHNLETFRRIAHKIENNELAGKISPHMLALFFTASIFPQRANSFKRQGKEEVDPNEQDESSVDILDALDSEDDLPYEILTENPDYESKISTRWAERIASFIEIFSNDLKPVDALKRLRFPMVLPDAFRAFLEGYLYIPSFQKENLSESDFQKHKEERYYGSIMFLSTCTPQMCDRIYSNWREHKDYVHYFTDQMLIEPSGNLSFEDRVPEESYLNKYWKDLQVKMTRDHCESPDDQITRSYITRAIELEKTLYKRISKGLSENEKSVTWVFEKVRLTWEKMVFEKLLSGFPHYAYLAPFDNWWNSNRDDWYRELRDERKLIRKAADVTAEGKSIYDLDLNKISAGKLAALDEGYRLVRSTFFSMKAGDNPISSNMVTRQALDRIWQTRIENIFFGSPGNKNETIDEETGLPETTLIAIREEYPKENITNHCKRLRERIAAYILVRFRKYSDYWLDSTYLTKKDDPLGEKPGVKAIANLARAVPESHTLLWALISRRKIHQLVDPRWKDPFSFNVVAEELWHFIRFRMFFEFISNGQEDDSRIDNELLNFWQNRCIKELIIRLRRIKTEEELHAFLEISHFTDEERIYRQFISQLCGKNGLHTGCTECLQNWKKIVPGYFIVPIWYLAIAQGLETPELIRSLKVGENLMTNTVEVADKMRQCAGCKTEKGFKKKD